MDNNIRNQLMDIYFENFQDKIVMDEDLKGYYQRVDEEDLKKVLGTYLLIQEDVTLLDKVPFSENYEKEEVVDYFLKNYEEIYGTIFLMLDDSMVKQWRSLLKMEGHYKVYVRKDWLSFSIEFIRKLYMFKLGQVNYNKEDGMIELCVPKDLLVFTKKLLQQKEFSKKRTYINQICCHVKGLLEAYGLLSLKKLTEVINQIYLKIEEEELESILRKITVQSDDFSLFGEGEEMLVGNICFEDEDEAYAFYESLPEGEYKLFTKKEYRELLEGEYHHKFVAYEELMFYLEHHLNFSEEELDDFDQWYVVDYLNSYQEDKEVANHHLMKNLEKDYDGLKIEDKMVIKKKLATLGKLYPVYYLKGYAEEESKIKESLCV